MIVRSWTDLDILWLLFHPSLPCPLPLLCCSGGGLHPVLLFRWCRQSPIFLHLHITVRLLDHCKELPSSPRFGVQKFHRLVQFMAFTHLERVTRKQRTQPLLRILRVRPALGCIPRWFSQIGVRSFCFLFPLLKAWWERVRESESEWRESEERERERERELK